VPHSDDTNLPFGSGAEFRSRLSWFIGVSDASRQDPGSLTYERYFDLREKPFSLSSDPRFFFSNSTHGAAFDTLAASIRRREGILVLTGEVGTGKTTLCRAVFESMDQKTFAAFVPDPFLSREDLLKTLLVDFGAVSVDEIRSGRLRGVSRTELSYPLYDFLASLQALGAFAVVMIDEAQNLTPELLEEIRILSDLENRHKLLQVLLVGQPELRLRLATSTMRQLSQRVSTRCELIPLAREDVRPYVSHRLMIAGNDGRVQFTDAAIDLVGTASTGIPRVINLVCDRALLRAAHSRTPRVDAEHVVWAVDDLGLPVAQTLGVPFGDEPGDGLAVAQTLGVPFGDQPGYGLAVTQTPGVPFGDQPGDGPALFRKEFQDEASTEPDDQDLPPSPDESLFPVSDPAAHTSGGLTPDVEPLPSALSSVDFGFPSAGFGGPNGETREHGFPEAEAAEPAIEEDFAAAGRRPNRLLALVAASLAVATSVVGYRYSSALASRQQPDVILPSEPRRPLQTLPGEIRSLSPTLEGKVTEVPPGRTGARLALQMATFQSQARAAQALQEFHAAGYHAYSTEVSLRDGARAVAVFLGPYAELAAAERDLDRARHMPGYGSGRLVQLDPSLQPPVLDP
jgi:type II secretory pathway predicted ATPase ExeA/cell division septation protein DedD